MQGLHLTADLYNCICDSDILINESTLADLCRKHTIDVGLTIVGEKWHTFPEYQGEPGGVTGTLLLAESHLAIHTWPERGGVTLDVYVCNFETDNSNKAQRLLNELEAAFKPQESQRNCLMRGESDGPAVKGELLLENLNETSVYGFRFDKHLLTQQTKYQHLELLQSKDLGLTLRLDGCLMTSEREEFFYHEALVHPATMAHESPDDVLIIGGGDGGALEELLKHPVKSATLIDLDEQVIQVAREHLQSINKGSLDNPRARVFSQDGVEFVKSTTDRFDLILLDLTDPETPAGPLYTQEFFVQCKSILKPGGAIVLHLGTPFFEPEQVTSFAKDLKAVFSQVHGYGLHIPLYGSYWALAVASDTLNPTTVSSQEIERRLGQRNIQDLQYYNQDVHGALFALPNFYKKLMQD